MNTLYGGAYEHRTHGDHGNKSLLRPVTLMEAIAYGGRTKSLYALIARWKVVECAT